MEESEKELRQVVRRREAVYSPIMLTSFLSMELPRAYAPTYLRASLKCHGWMAAPRPCAAT